MDIHPKRFKMTLPASKAQSYALLPVLKKLELTVIT